MRIFEALYKHLVAQAGITALVGSGSNARIYDHYAEQGRSTDYPCIVIEEVDDERYHAFSAAPTATRRPVAVACYRTGNPTLANALADLVYAALVNNAAAVTTSAGSLTVKSFHFEGRRNEYEADLEDSAKLFSCTLEFSVIHDV